MSGWRFASISGRVILMILVLITGQACGGQSAPHEPTEVPVSALPGTEESNAGKAIRALFERLEEREGKRGHDLLRLVREDPGRFRGDIPAIEAAAAIDHCDWGTPRTWDASLPHISAVHGFALVLITEAQAAGARGDGETAARLLTAVFRLGRHANTGISVVEKMVAARSLKDAAEVVRGLVSEGSISVHGAERLQEASAFLEGDDPFRMRESILLEGDRLIEGLRAGDLKGQSFEELGGRSFRGPGAWTGRRIAEPLRVAYAEIAAAWGTPGFADAARAAAEKAERTTKGYGWLVPSYGLAQERIEASLAEVEAMKAVLREAIDQKGSP